MSTPAQRIELAAWTQTLPTRTRGAIRRRAIVGRVAGALLVLLVVVALTVAVATGQGGAELLVGVVLVGGIGILLWRNGTRHLRALPAGPADQPVQFAAPYAFEIDGSTLRFPAFFGHPAEEWPLERTRVEATAQALRLACPGWRPRRYSAKGLALPPGEVAAIIASARRA